MVESTEWENFSEHDWERHWYPEPVAIFREPLVRFHKSQEAVEDLVEKGSAPLLENNNWRRAELVKELDFRDVYAYFQFGEQTIFIDNNWMYRTITEYDTDCSLPLEAIVEMYRESEKSDRLLPDDEEMYIRGHHDEYVSIFPFDPSTSTASKDGRFFLLVDETWHWSGLTEPNPVAVGIVFQSPFAKWVIDGERWRNDQGWRRLPQLEYGGVAEPYSCHPITSRVECLQLLDNSEPIERYAEHVAFNRKDLSEEAWAIIQDSRARK